MRYRKATIRVTNEMILQLLGLDGDDYNILDSKTDMSADGINYGVTEFTLAVNKDLKLEDIPDMIMLAPTSNLMND